MRTRLATTQTMIQRALLFVLLLLGYWVSFSRVGIEAMNGMAQAPNDTKNLPATYHGAVLPDPAVPGFTPTVGVAVRAEINGKTCGQSTTINENGQVSYRISVLSDSEIDGLPGCGVQGAIVTFFVADQFMQPTVSWSAGAIQGIPIHPALPPTSTPQLSVTPTQTPLVTPTITPPHRPVTIPEPLSITLFGAGLMVLKAVGVFRKRVRYRP